MAGKAKNRNLHQAKTSKKDEFYTQLPDIERELRHHWWNIAGLSLPAFDEKDFTVNDSFLDNLDLYTPNGELNYVAYLLADQNSVSIKVAKYSGTDKPESGTHEGLSRP